LRHSKRWAFGLTTWASKGDDATAYRQSIEKAVREGADLILSTGAVSMGKVDFVPEVLSDLKAKVHFS
jgi:molybdopterin molybdotransferase